MWEIKRHQEMGEDRLDIGLFCKKSNISQIFKPLGFQFAFDDDAIYVHKQDIRDVPELAVNLKWADQIENILRRGPMSGADLATELDTTQDLIRTTCNRNKDKRFIRLTNDRWALKARENE